MKKLLVTIALFVFATASVFSNPLAGKKFWLLYNIEYVYEGSIFREKGLSCGVFGFVEYLEDGTYKIYDVDEKNNIEWDEYKVSSYSCIDDGEFTLLLNGKEKSKNLLIELFTEVFMVIPEKTVVDSTSSFTDEHIIFMISEQAMKKYYFFSFAG